MATWEDLKGSLFAAGRDVSQKAKEVSEIAKLKMDIRAKEDFVEKQYAALGQAYYEASKDNANEKEAEQFRVIKEALDEIERMNQQMLDIQGVVLCPNCGKKAPVTNCFCSDCGAKLNDVVVEAEVISEESIVEAAADEPVAEEAAEEAVAEPAEEVVAEPVAEEVVVEEKVTE